MDKKEFTGPLYDLDQLDEAINKSETNSENTTEINDSQHSSINNFDKETPIDTKTEKNKAKKILIGAGSAALVGVVLVGSAIGINTFGNSKEAAAETPTTPNRTESTQTSHTTNIEEPKYTTNTDKENENTIYTETTDESAELIKDVQPPQNTEVVDNSEILQNTIENVIDYELLRSDPKKAMELFEENFVLEFVNTGATKENAKKAIASGDVRSYMAKIADELEPDLIAAYFSDDAMLRPGVQSFLERLSVWHEDVLTYAASTSDPSLDRADKEQYKVSGTVTGIISMSEGTNDTITIEYASKNYDNGLMTHYQTNMVKGDEVSVTVTFINKDGKAVVDDLTRNGATGN